MWECTCLYVPVFEIIPHRRSSDYFMYTRLDVLSLDLLSLRRGQGIWNPWKDLDTDAFQVTLLYWRPGRRASDTLKTQTKVNGKVGRNLEDALVQLSHFKNVVIWFAKGWLIFEPMLPPVLSSAFLSYQFTSLSPWLSEVMRYRLCGQTKAPGCMLILLWRAELGDRVHPR